MRSQLISAVLVSLDDGNIGRVDGLHADDVIAAVDVMNFTRHATAKVGL